MSIFLVNFKSKQLLDSDLIQAKKTAHSKFDVINRSHYYMIIAEFMGCTTSPLVFVLHTFTGVRLIVTLGYYQNGRLAIAYIN